jgi:hypothetical protein
VRLRISDGTPELNGKLKNVYRELKGHPGDASVLVDVSIEGIRAIMKARDLNVDPTEDLARRVFEISGGGVEVV